MQFRAGLGKDVRENDAILERKAGAIGCFGSISDHGPRAIGTAGDVHRIGGQDHPISFDRREEAVEIGLRVEQARGQEALIQ